MRNDGDKPLTTIMPSELGPNAAVRASKGTVSNRSVHVIEEGEGGNSYLLPIPSKTQ